MLTLTSGESDFLKQSTERNAAVRLDILDLATGVLVKRIQSMASDALSGEVLAITGGNVRVDTAAETLRTLTLELVDPLHELALGIGKIIGPDKLLKVYKGYQIPSPWGSGAYTFWPLGAFILNGVPEIDATGGKRTIRIQAGDKSCLANRRPRGGFRTAYRVSQGALKKDAIKAIAQYETWAETEFNLAPESTQTVPYDQPFTDQQSPWEAATKIAAIPEANGNITRLYYDAYGRLTLWVDPGPDLDNLPAVWTAQSVTSGFSQLVGAKLAPDILSFRNASRVKWGSSRVTPGVVTIYDSTATSDTYVGKIGWFIEDWKNGQQDDLIRNSAEATARANYEYKRLKSYQERVPMTLVEQPALEPWDVVQVVESQADINGKYQLLSFTVDLGGSGILSAEGWRVRKLV